MQSNKAKKQEDDIKRAIIIVGKCKFHIDEGRNDRVLNLPTQTEINKPLPKNAIFQKLMLNTAQKESFDNDISRIYIANEISERTINITKGETIDSIFVLLVHLKRKEYADKNITILSKMIDRNIVYLMKFEEEYQLGIYHTKLIKSAWSSSPTLTITGLNLDMVWDNIVMNIGDVTVNEGNTLVEQIMEDDHKAKLSKQIERLEKQARAEKQPKKKFELVQEIKNLKKNIGG